MRHERQLARYGPKLSAEAPLSPLVTKLIKSPAGKVPVQVPKGIDPGFAYNPGVAGLAFPRSPIAGLT